MAQHNRKGRVITLFLSTLMGIEFSIFGIATPSLSQTYGGQQQSLPYPPASLPLNGNLVPLDSAPPKTGTPQFKFTNGLEYSDCLEVILQLYQNQNQLNPQLQRSSCLTDIQKIYGSTGLSKIQALSLVSSANFYATTILSRKLHPPRGQRQRIAKMLGFIYETDANDQQIKDLATQN